MATQATLDRLTAAVHDNTSAVVAEKVKRADLTAKLAAANAALAADDGAVAALADAVAQNTRDLTDAPATAPDPNAVQL